MQLKTITTKAKKNFSCKTIIRIIPNFEQNPANGGIPATENNKIEKVNAKIIFHFLRKDQLTMYLRKRPLSAKFNMTRKIPTFITI